MELLKQEMELYSYLQTSDQKTSFTKVFPVNPMSPKPILETGNRIIKTGKGIILHTYRLLIKILLSKKFYIQSKESKPSFRNRK